MFASECKKAILCKSAEGAGWLYLKYTIKQILSQEYWHFSMLISDFIFNWKLCGKKESIMKCSIRTSKWMSNMAVLNKCTGLANVLVSTMLKLCTLFLQIRILVWLASTLERAGSCSSQNCLQKTSSLTLYNFPFPIHVITGQHITRLLEPKNGFSRNLANFQKRVLQYSAYCVPNG